MSIPGFLLPETTTDCSYLSGRASTTENFIPGKLTESDMEGLLASGYRHFGPYFYRPICKLCHQCIPLRIPLDGFSFSKSGRRAASLLLPTWARGACGTRLDVPSSPRELRPLICSPTAILADHPDATVLHVGCGMDSRVFRVDPPATVQWFDVDYPDVIELRR